MQRNTRKGVFVQGLLVVLIFCLSNPMVYAAAWGSKGKKRGAAGSSAKSKPGTPARALLSKGPLQVKKVHFRKVKVFGKTRVEARVVFTRAIDPSSVTLNNNVRMLRRNEQKFWVDAAKQGNFVDIQPTYIRWTSGAQARTGVYIMRLMGTVKAADGTYLDCDGDGRGEGGALPAYESRMFGVVAMGTSGGKRTSLKKNGSDPADENVKKLLEELQNPND